jgi:hypothetical protein
LFVADNSRGKFIYEINLQVATQDCLRHILRCPSV